MPLPTLEEIRTCERVIAFVAKSPMCTLTKEQALGMMAQTTFILRWRAGFPYAITDAARGIFPFTWEELMDFEDMAAAAAGQ